MTKSNSWEVSILNLTFKNASQSALANVHFALFTSAPNDAGGGTEVSGGSYARVAVATAGSNFTVNSGDPSSAVNAVDITFPIATANWGTITHFGIFDASTAGNMRYWGALPVAREILNGDRVICYAGDCVITED